MADASESLLRKPCVRFSLYETQTQITPKNAMVFLLLRDYSCPKKKAMVKNSNLTLQRNFLRNKIVNMIQLKLQLAQRTIDFLSINNQRNMLTIKAGVIFNVSKITFKLKADYRITKTKTNISTVDQFIRNTEENAQIHEQFTKNMAHHMPEWHTAQKIKKSVEEQIEKEWKVKINLNTKTTNVHQLMKKNYDIERKALQFTLDQQKFKEIPQLIFQDRIDYLKSRESASLFQQNNDICNCPAVQNVKLFLNQQQQRNQKSRSSIIFPTQRDLELKLMKTSKLDLMQLKGEDFREFIKEQSDDDENAYTNLEVSQKKQQIQKILKYGYGHELRSNVKKRSVINSHTDLLHPQVDETHKILQRFINMQKLKDQKINEHNLEQMVDFREQNMNKIQRRMLRKAQIKSLETSSIFSSQRQIKLPTPSCDMTATVTITKSVDKDVEKKYQKKQKMYGKFIFPQPPIQFIVDTYLLIIFIKKPTPVIQ